MRKFFDRLFNSKPSSARASASPPEPVRAPEPPPFEPENELERILVAAARDPALRPEFQTALLKAELYAATPQRPASSAAGSRVLEADEKVSMLTVVDAQGAHIPAVFTSLRRLASAFGEGVGFVSMEGAVLLGLLCEKGAVLNPTSPYRVHWTPEQLCALLGKPVSWTVKENTEVLLGVPAERPEALIAELQKALMADPRVREAWFALAHWPKSGEWSWYLDVRADMPRDEVNKLLAHVFTSAALEGRPLDMIVNPPNGRQGAGIRLVPAGTN